MRLTIALVLLLVAALVGCGGEKKNTLAPVASIVSQEAPTSVTWTWLDATHLEKISTYRRTVNGQTVTIGTIKVVYICDYPVGTYGPPAPGHCYTNGTGCTD